MRGNTPLESEVSLCDKGPAEIHIFSLCIGYNFAFGHESDRTNRLSDSENLHNHGIFDLTANGVAKKVLTFTAWLHGFDGYAELFIYFLR